MVMTEAMHQMQPDAEPEAHAAHAAGFATSQAAPPSPAVPLPVTPGGALAVVYCGLERLVPDPGNARTHPKR